MMTEIDVKALTKEAEAGHCSQIKAVFEPLPFEESLKVMQQIDKQSDRNRLSDSTCPKFGLVVMGTAPWQKLT